MKIAVDCRALTGIKTGGGYYTQNLLKSLSEIDRENEYLLCAHKPIRFPSVGSGMRIAQGSCFSGFVWQNLFLPGIIRREKAGLFHSPLFTLPLKLDCPGIITVFDLTPVLFPRLHLFKVRFAFKQLGGSIRKARKIIAISRSTANDLVYHLGVERDRISVIYPGVGASFSPAGEAEKEAARRKYAGGRRFMLHVGTLEPRKNLGFLIDVFSHMIRLGNDPGLDLVLVGGEGWKYGEIFKKITEHGLRDRVKTPGYVGEEELPAVYSAAEVFVYPSLYEGFGLPLVESMACGTPVIAGWNSSVPEVVADAGLLIKGWNMDTWADKIKLLAGDKSAGAELSRKGLVRAGKFGWRECAEKTLELYNAFRA